jgi:hypothetical protein
VEILPSHHEIAGLGRDKVEAKQVGAPCGDDIVSSSRQDVARSPVWPSPRARAARRYTSPGARVVHAQHRALSSAGATSPIGHFYFSPSGRDITSVRGSVERVGRRWGTTSPAGQPCRGVMSGSGAGSTRPLTAPPPLPS